MTDFFFLFFCLQNLSSILSFAIIIPCKWGIFVERVIEQQSFLLPPNILALDKKQEEELFRKMFGKKKDMNYSIQFQYQDYVILSKMVHFIFLYTGDNLYNDLFSYMQSFSGGQFVFSFYVYYVYLLNKHDYVTADETFKEKCKQLFYDGEVEFLLGMDAYPLLPSPVSLGEVSLEEEIDASLLSYVRKKIPSTIQDPLELSLAIYILLNQFLRYFRSFLVFGYQRPVPAYSSVSCTQNDVICVTWAILYYKLLRLYGIPACLVGRFDKHMFVHLKVGSLLLKADATTFGVDENDFYHMSDIGNCKLGIRIRSFQLRENCYPDKERLSFYKKKLDRVISLVYEKLQLPCHFQDTLEVLSEKVVTRYLSLDSFDQKEIQRRMQLLSSFLPIQDCQVESLQFTKMLLQFFFPEILDGVEVISLYHEEEQVDLLFLLHFEDLEGNHMYYLETPQGVYPYEVDSLVDFLVMHDYHFKNSCDVDALHTSMERKLMLIKKES